MNNKFLVGLVVLMVGVGAGWYFLQSGKTTPEKKQDTRFTETTPAAEPTVTLSTEAPVMGKTSVSYGASGFVPNTVTVKKGAVVVWTNQSQSGMWVASAVHPTHQLLPGFDELKSVGVGGTYEYTFDKVGTWKYHMHRNPSDTGTVVVME